MHLRSCQKSQSMSAALFENDVLSCCERFGCFIIPMANGNERYRIVVSHAVLQLQDFDQLL